MKIKRIRVDSIFRRKAIRAAKPACLALISFLAGAIFHARTVEADSHHTFELMVYHTLPGKVPALESVFRNVSALQAKHGIHAVGYWIPTGSDPTWKDTFVYLVVHPSQEAAEANWQSLHADPAFQPYFTAAAPLIQQIKGNYKVDEVYMRPTGYSNLK